MSQRFVQLSDPHLSSLADVRPAELLNKRLLGYLSWRRKRRFEHRSEVLEALLEDLGGESLSQVLVTGDLTHVGLPNEFAQVREWLQRLGTADTVALVPGNHDSCVSTPWQDTYALWEDYMASDSEAGGNSCFPSLRIRGDIAFIGLSTACPTPPIMATGRVDDPQLAALPGMLADTGSRRLFRVLYLHHSPVPGHDKWLKRLVNADAIAGIIAAQGAELVLHGHGHRRRRDTLQSRVGDVPVVAVPSASALGLHGADIAAYNCYRVERSPRGWDLEIRTRRFHPEREQFDDGEIESVRIGRP